MKMIKDEHKYLKQINKKFKNKKINNLESVLKNICYYYGIYYPVILEYRIEEIGNDLTIKILDNEYNTKNLTITISTNENDYVTVYLNNKEYIDCFNLYGDDLVKLDKRIYESKAKKIVIEEHMFNNYSYYLKYKEKINDTDSNIYKGFLFNFKNKYLNGELSFSILETYPFVESLFIKELFESKIEITDIDTLFCIVKKILNCSNANIKVENNTKNGKEVINYNNGKLMEYIRIKDAKKIEYKDGYKELLVSKYETESIENQEFQKVLKMIRS